MSKREYDKEYQRSMTRVIQVRLHIERDDDVLYMLDQKKVWGHSYAQTIKEYFRLGLQYEHVDPSHITDDDKAEYARWLASLND